MMNEKFENVNHLVLNFYPDGYSLAVKLNEFPVFTSETILETAKISYDETSLLSYIENEELPPILVEMIDGSPKLSQYKIWHNGCLILEVRDKINLSQGDNNNSKSQSTTKEFPAYSKLASTDSSWSLDQSIDNEFDLDSQEPPTNLSAKGYFILLKPTNLSMLNDVLNLTQSNSWSNQDRLQLESQIVLHNSPPLFLDVDEGNNGKQALEQDSQVAELEILANIHTRHKRKLPYKKIMNKTGCKNGNNSSKSSNNNHLDRLPPELTLQQFLAAKRAKKKTFVAGHLARFHRFKKHLSSNKN